MGKPNALGGSWCKHCNIFVKDTPLEKKNHETSFKHQNNIQKTLRTLHKTKEREDREKEQAKAEVARLNRTANGTTTRPSPVTNLPSHRNNAPPGPKPASSASAAEDRQRKLEQLAALGVAVPDHDRHDMAMPGEWKTVSTTVLKPQSIVEAGDEADDKSGTEPFESRKRRTEADSGSDGEHRQKKRWGTSLRVYPGADAGGESDADLDALLAASLTRKPAKTELAESSVKLESTNAADDPPNLKRSDSEEQAAIKASLAATADVAPADSPGADAASAAIVFKKRKANKR